MLYWKSQLTERENMKCQENAFSPCRPAPRDRALPSRGEWGYGGLVSRRLTNTETIT